MDDDVFICPGGIVTFFLEICVGERVKQRMKRHPTCFQLRPKGVFSAYAFTLLFDVRLDLFIER